MIGYGALLNIEDVFEDPGKVQSQRQSAKSKRQWEAVNESFENY